MGSQWLGAVDLGSGWLRYEGPVIGAELHSHHAIQVIATCHPVTLFSASGASVTTDRAIVPADVEHRIHATGQQGTLTYLEPPPMRGVAPPDPATWASAGADLPDLGTGADLAAVEALRDHLSNRPTQDSTGLGPDLRVLEAQAAVRGLLPDRVRLPEIAGLVGISPSRLTHRFSTVTGIPFGRWVPTVAARVGHATPVTALAIYGHALPVDGHDAADVLAVMLDRATARRGVLTPSTY